MIYCLKNATGMLYEDTFSSSRRECWCNAFELISRLEGLEWRDRYWKRYQPFVDWAKRKGWRVVECDVAERP